MHPLEIILWLIAVVLAVMAFRVTVEGLGLHWGVALVLAAVPIGATLALGGIGLLASAVVVGGLYKASA
jgi:hypothetical protein